jgi:hypothetical protein
MATASLPYTIPNSVTRKVNRLRRLVRGYVLVEGLAAVAMAIAVAFWLGLALDWLFEPSPVVRVGMWIVALAGIGYVAWRWLFARLAVRLTDSNLALLLERAFPQIDQSLVTTLQAGRRGDLHSDWQTELLKHTGREAGDKLATAPLSKVFRYWPLVWKSLLSVLLVSAMAIFATHHTETFRFWVQRMKLSTQLWPRAVELSVVGFKEIDGELVMNVARDDDVQLEVLSSLENEHVAPREVEIRYELADGRRGRDMFTQIGEAVAGEDANQPFRYEFKNLSTDITFDVIGGDDRVRGLKLHVVERPQIVRTSLECDYPQYLGWAPVTRPFSGRAEVPFGTKVVCQIETSKPLAEVSVYDSASKEAVSAQLDEKSNRQFSFSLDALDADRVLLVDLKDTEGVTNREPYRLMVAVVPDEVPEVSVQLRGIGSAVTPQAVIPMVGTVVDDHGVASTWIQAEYDKREPQRRDLAEVSATRENEELGQFDLAELDPETEERRLLLKPGEKITLSVKAQDAYDLETTNLEKGPHVGSSQRFLLDVVTDSELRALLEKRELGLRQRFEAIHEKMISTRDLITRIELQPKGEDGQPVSGDALTTLMERDNLRIAGIDQNATQLSYETFGIAEGFEDIVTELVNNRIDTEELTQRLGRDIAEPLRAVAGELMPELQKRVQLLPEALAGGDGAEKRLADAVIQADLVVEAMQKVLDRMLELENYNELVELLRTIVDEQKQLNEETKVRHREKLRSLLDE